MAKYYVTCMDQSRVVSAKDPLEACVLVSEALNMTTCGVSWVVSERGFEKHEDDEFVPDELIIRELIKRAFKRRPDV